MYLIMLRVFMAPVIATTSGSPDLLGLGFTVVSNIMIIFMFYHRSNQNMYSDSDSDYLDLVSAFGPTLILCNRTIMKTPKYHCVCGLCKPCSHNISECEVSI